MYEWAETKRPDIDVNLATEKFATYFRGSEKLSLGMPSGISRFERHAKTNSIGQPAKAWTAPPDNRAFKQRLETEQQRKDEGNFYGS